MDYSVTEGSRPFVGIALAKDLQSPDCVESAGTGFVAHPRVFLQLFFTRRSYYSTILTSTLSIRAMVAHINKR